MTSYSPTVYAYPDGVSIGTSTASQGTRILGAASAAVGEGNYFRTSPPPIRNVATGADYAPVYVSGFEELYVMPMVVADASFAGTMYVWVYYGNKAQDSDQNFWTVKLLYSVALTAGGLVVSSPGGTQYTSAAVAVTNNFNGVLDNTIGASTGSRTGSADLIGVIGSPHLGGADYIGITFSGSANAAVANAMIRMG
jgi:hypothetical protein